jgi:carbon monoxide dehydrogenase subunit G
MKAKGREHAAWPWFFLAIGVIVAGVGVFFAVKWLAFDEPAVYGKCFSGGSSCQKGGEQLNMVFALGFGPLGLLGTAFGVRKVRRHRARAAADRLLLAQGQQGEAVITDVHETGQVTRTNGRITSQDYVIMVDPEDGGGPIRMEVELPPGVTAGSLVRIAYDPVKRDAVLLEVPV